MDLRLRKNVGEVIVIWRDEHNHRRARTVYKRRRRSKKGTGSLPTLGRVVRDMVASQETAARTYLHRHDESNRDKTDGWIRELSYNVYRATSRGMGKLRRSLGLPSVEID